MANAHHLFYSTETEKETLHRRIVPNKDQREMQQDRWNQLNDYLKDMLSVQSGYSISSWLQGSYKFGTQIRPKDKFGEFDIDLGIYFNWLGDNENSAFTPLELKDMVHEALVEYQQNVDGVKEVVDPPKERCERIRYIENFHIDTPTYHLDEGRDYRALATQSNRWEESDPKAIYQWFREKCSNQNSNQVHRLIRYLKMWAKLNLTEPPSSLLLTVLAAEAYQKLEDSVLGADDTAFYYVCSSIQERIQEDNSVTNPIDASEELNQLSNQENQEFVNGLDMLIQRADQALNANSVFEAAIAWSTLFRHFFPIPEDVVDEKSNDRALQVALFEPDVFVEAKSKTNKNHTPFRGNNRIGPIPKQCKINFSIRNVQDIPAGAHIRWVVRNEGEEAEFKNDLGHLAEENTNHTTETSEYKGTHYMDVIVTLPF